MKKIFALLTLLSLFGWNAVAQKAPEQKPVPKSLCANAPDQATMNQCALEAFQKADAELNKAYQQLLSKLEAAHKEKLKTAQRAWIAFRDAHCECESFTFDGGSMQPMIRGYCLAATTTARTKQLQAMLKEMTNR